MLRTRILCLGLLFLFCPALLVAESPRITRDLQVLYTFEATEGEIIRDRSGVGEPLDLKIEKPSAVQRYQGRLVVRQKTRIQSATAAKKILQACKRSGELTVEAWIKPANTRQEGPARIVSLSKDTSNRNFTLGQEGNRYDFRLRVTSTSKNGMPSTASPSRSLETKLTHVVYTRDASGQAKIYLDTQPRASKKVSGKLSVWDDRYHLSLANELTNNRPWEGEFHLVAIYSRALSENEVQQNFKAGPAAGMPPEVLAARKRAAAARHFETQVTPILAQRCVECHDSINKQGGLDLSRKTAARHGGDSGKVLVPGKPAESLLWQRVKSDEMPPDREPLSEREKAALQKWIDAGAVWSLDFIDPAVYALGHGSDEVWVQRLTVDEYIATVRSAVGVDISEDAREILPPDLRADGFRNTAYNLNVDLKHVAAYAELAERIVQRMDIEKFTARFSKDRRLNKHNRTLVERMGKWLLRGPLDEREIATYRGIATTVVSAGGDFEEAMSYVVEAMLQSPRFLYRIEQQRGSGQMRPAGQWELASRLSYIIWGAPPDEALFRLADQGKLDREACLAQAQRMLQDPRAKQKSLQFVAEWLNLGRLQNMQPSRKHFPYYTPELGADMREETLRFFEEIVWKQKRPLSDLLNAQFTFATPRLAKHYGLQPKSDANDLAPYDLADRPERGGLLTQASVLTVGGDEASMVSRGLFVLHDLLRGVVKDPPPCVDTTPLPTKAGLTQRSIAEGRIANVNCGGCHAKFEPLAFGLEKFDGLGAFHQTDEHGNRLREDGTIRFPGGTKEIEYDSSAELMDLLAQSERVKETLTWKLTQFALGRPLGPADAKTVAEIHLQSQQNGGTYHALLRAILGSDLVQMTRMSSHE